MAGSRLQQVGGGSVRAQDGSQVNPHRFEIVTLRVILRRVEQKIFTRRRKNIDREKICATFASRTVRAGIDQRRARAREEGKILHEGALGKEWPNKPR
jgi:hypothetical protein